MKIGFFVCKFLLGGVFKDLFACKISVSPLRMDLNFRRIDRTINKSSY